MLIIFKQNINIDNAATRPIHICMHYKEIKKIYSIYTLISIYSFLFYYYCFILLLLSVSSLNLISFISFFCSEISYCFGYQMAPSTGKSPMGTQTSSGSQVHTIYDMVFFSFYLNFLSFFFDI